MVGHGDVEGAEVVAALHARRHVALAELDDVRDGCVGIGVGCVGGDGDVAGVPPALFQGQLNRHSG